MTLVDASDSHSCKTSNMDPTLLMTTMRLNTDTSTTSSTEPNRSHPNCDEQEPACFTLNQETALLTELLEELKKNTQNLSSKLDESQLRFRYQEHPEQKIILMYCAILFIYDFYLYSIP
jgi:hypothetical protein